MNLKQRLKKAAWTVLPYPVIRSIKKRHYAKLVASSGPHQEPDIHIVRHLVEPGNIAVDVGANIGVYTWALSKLVGAGGRVYSFEPFPSTFDILSNTVTKLGLENVELMNVALSDTEAVVAMEIPSNSSGAETHYRAHVVTEADGATPSTAISATTLDAALSSAASRVSFVKCDVEGHELACIKGASSFLANSGAAWLVEVSGDPDDDTSSAHEVFTVLRGHDYSAWRYDGDRLIERRHGDHSVNYFFLKREHIAALGKKGVTLVSAETN